MVLALSEAERVGGLPQRALKPLDIAPPAVAAALSESRYPDVRHTTGRG